MVHRKFLAQRLNGMKSALKVLPVNSYGGGGGSGGASSFFADAGESR